MFFNSMPFAVSRKHVSTFRNFKLELGKIPKHVYFERESNAEGSEMNFAIIFNISFTVFHILWTVTSIPNQIA